MRSRAPRWWTPARAELAGRDPVLAALLARYPDYLPKSRGDAFGTLARSIVGQQISVRAADTIWARLEAAVPAVAPAPLAGLTPERLRACGLSGRKAEYLAGLALAFDRGEVDPARWRRMDDLAVIRDLTRLRGIGRWSAEMFLLFHLLRPDVLPRDDIGLQRAIALHYLDGRMPGAADFDALDAAWRPWRSLPTFLLWRSLDPVAVAY